MPWWLKALFAGMVIAAASAGGGYLLARPMPGDEWLFAAILLLALVTAFLLKSSYPRRFAPSHTRRARHPIQNAGLQQMAFQESSNPGEAKRPRTWNLDLLIAAIPPLVTALTLIIFAVR